MFTLRLVAVGLLFFPWAALPYLQNVNGTLRTMVAVLVLAGVGAVGAEFSRAFDEFDEHGIKRPFRSKLAWTELESTATAGRTIIFYFRRGGGSACEVRVPLWQFKTPKAAFELFRQWAGERGESATAG